MDNILKIIGSRIERNFKLLKMKAMNSYFPEILNEPTSLHTRASTTTLNSITERELGARFVELDRNYKTIKSFNGKLKSMTSCGLTRQILLNCLMNMGKYSEEIEKEFLRNSPYIEDKER